MTDGSSTARASGAGCVLIPPEGTREGARTLARKALRQGYYWPSMKVDARGLFQKCQQCQLYANADRAAPAELTPIAAAWPFSTWGIDLLGPLPVAIEQPRGWRFKAVESMARARGATSKFYNARVKARDLAHHNKLTPKWEGLYKVIGVPNPNAYVLQDK
ncbi:hypothetical protein CRG98_042100 [Punica granatum]|uniref:Integrase zinc-binding domain-containing protein n=1 Tax=Punica granatum TaxID=22663 RepID=A0A2I0I0M4_PUNGR|nr:hypothetical protein CRG98_042100 [Punica granatum]